VWLNPHLKLRAAVSRAFRLPSFTDLYYHDPANRGTPDLRPEQAWSYEAGVDWHGGAKMRGSLAWFQRRERDVIDYVRYSPDDIWRAANVQRLRLTGIEASVEVRAARAHVLDFGYTALHGMRDALGALMSRYVFNYPEHAGVASWRGTLPGGLIASTRLGASQRRGRDPYAVWDLTLACDRSRLRPFLQVSNMTGTYREEIAGVPLPGRTTVLGLELLVSKIRK